MNDTIELFAAGGEPVFYRPPAALPPEFLARFGPERGFSVRTEISDLLGLRPGLLRLYEAAAREGRTAEAPGLPPLSAAAGTMVCRAVLEGADGRVLATATAAKDVRAPEDLETLETAARRRLLAAVGFGGEAPAADGRRDLAASGPDPAPVGDAGPAAAPDAGRPPTPAAPVADAAEDAPEDRALALLRRQIGSHARLLGIEPPAATTVGEAQAALKRLIGRRGS